MSLKRTLSAGRPSASNTTKAATLASLADVQETKRVNFDLTAEQHAKLKVYAAKRGTTIKQVLAAYVDSLPNE